jgi:hypothetical protein
MNLQIIKRFHDGFNPDSNTLSDDIMNEQKYFDDLKNFSKKHKKLASFYEHVDHKD